MRLDVDGVTGGPPRVRRNLSQRPAPRWQAGWTSARAEEPIDYPARRKASGVDLRACGGTLKILLNSLYGKGGPPRVRRNLAHSLRAKAKDRWTSARAEEPAETALPVDANWVDLRACGGTRSSTRPPRRRAGGPPRVRRNRIPPRP